MGDAPDEPSFYAEAKAEFDRETRQESKPKPNGPNGIHERAKPLRYVTAPLLKGKQKPREFLDVSEIFPHRNVALFMGDGAVGKSLLALQLAVACTTGTQWLGVDVAQGPVVYFSCEDDEQEIANRLNEICDAEGIDLGEAWEFNILPMVGEDTVLGQEVRGRIQPTPVFHRLCSSVEDVNPVLVILDNLADVFSGNENNRTHAKQFITLLRGMCLKYDCMIALLGHPSLSGRSSGTGESGSTAWNNSVRVRPYLYKPDGADAAEGDRIFEVKKANYAAPGGVRWELKWQAGRFVRSEPQSAFSRIKVDDVDRVKERFAAGHWRVNEQSIDWGGKAVAEVLDWDIGSGTPAKERSGEQNKNRANIRTYLATWVRAKSIFVVTGLTHKREKVEFYSNRPPD